MVYCSITPTTPHLRKKNPSNVLINYLFVWLLLIFLDLGIDCRGSSLYFSNVGWRPGCNVAPLYPHTGRSEIMSSVWLFGGCARCLVALQPRHFGHVPYTLPATTQSPAAPKACWGLDRFPAPTHRPQLRSQPEQSRKLLSCRNIQSRRKGTTAAAAYCGCEFLTSSSKPRSCKSSLGNYTMGERCTAALSISDSLQHYSGKIIISLDT